MDILLVLTGIVKSISKSGDVAWSLDGDHSRFWIEYEQVVTDIKGLINI